ncbi:DNA cytosine methyltransferase [Paractinoplanes brasiliensis]|uniref:DNA cytosine methyltransferase n=1 Tax=Paractinoplanes brasiliensis TaxID=52695 RepID=UPI001A3AB482|nr:DNA (cytosine-5-)-methyltransferase [Actinoplanes brasiliensis]GID32677.1 putative BsuMI modification methylase subunit YdiP [Actinoplanes brasiliensis]
MSSEVDVTKHRLRVAGLFAGVGGLELGLKQAGLQTAMLCEVWTPAKAVLTKRFSKVPLEPDVQHLEALPDDVDVVTAGFPCQDLSQAGRTAGIAGEQSGLVSHVFRLLKKHHPRWLVLENVRNMLVLDKGKAMLHLVQELEALGYRWAYRLVDSRFTGVPQRRQRVLFVASRTEDPRAVLFSEDAGDPAESDRATDAYGFYWTEGLTGLGWAQDAVPTVKGGSGLGIPSPPAIWIPGNPLGRRIVTPSITDAEQLQGFPKDWTLTEATAEKKNGRDRWKLVGNAVTVGVSKWLGERLLSPGAYDEAEAVPMLDSAPWPTAAWGYSGKRWRSTVSMWPRHAEYTHLMDLVDEDGLTPLSYRAAAGFYSRTQRAKLKFDEEFLLDMKEHVELMDPDRLKPLSV